MKKRPTIDAAAADKLISEFAENFKELTNGGSMPRFWKQRLLRALEPEPKRAGLKIDAIRYAAIVRDLALAGKAARDRNKANNPAKTRREIAKRHGVSERTVVRVQRDVPTDDDTYFMNVAELEPRRRLATIDGLAQAAAAWLDEKYPPDKI